MNIIKFILIFTFLYIIFVIYAEKKPFSLINFAIYEKSKYDFDIDVVILFVNGSDPKWFSSMIKMAKLINHPLSENYISKKFIEHNELLYSIRSILKNIPWVRKIFLVQDDQIPLYINKSYEKLSFISHQLLFGKSRSVFNTNAIHFSLYKIPGLSKKFILLDDDYFVMNPMSKSDFFTPEGYPIVRARKGITFSRRRFKIVKKKCNNDDTTLMYHYGIYKSYYAVQDLYRNFNNPLEYDHVALPMDLDIVKDVVKIYETDAITRNPFRVCGEYSFTNLCYYHGLAINKTITKIGDSFAAHSNKNCNLLIKKKRQHSLICGNYCNNNFYNVFLKSIFPNKTRAEKY